MSEQSFEEMTAETLSGDLRDVMLTHIRSMEDPWSKLSEIKQQDKIYAVTNACEHIVRQAVRMIAANGHEVIDVKIDKFTVKDTIKMDVAANVTVNNIERLAENRGRNAILTFVSAADFIGQQAPATADKDQPELPIDDEDGEQADLDDGTTHDNNTAPAATDDELYEKAVAAVRLSGKPSTSFVQRTLEIGYNAAARLVDRMEKEGVVSAATTAGKREILTGSQTETPAVDPSDAPKAA